MYNLKCIDKRIFVRLLHYAIIWQNTILLNAIVFQLSEKGRVVYLKY